MGMKYRTEANVVMTDPAHPDRPIQFLAYRLSRGLSVLFQLATVYLLFVVARHYFGETAGFVAAWFGAVTMGLVNMAHFATGESMLFMLCLWALWRFTLVADRGTWRDYVARRSRNRAGLLDEVHAVGARACRSSPRI